MSTTHFQETALEHRSSLGSSTSLLRKHPHQSSNPSLPRAQGSLRAYHSDISLAPGGAWAARLSRSTSNISDDSTASSSALQRSHSLLDDLDAEEQHTCAEILLAAETLENMVNESVFVGAAPYRKMKSGNLGQSALWRDNMGDKVLKLVYGTMKYLPYIDTILVKTQFLVYNNEFLNQLAIVKIMIYDLMKNHFDYHKYPGIDYTLPADALPTDKDHFELVKELDQTLRGFQVKLAAAYARVRIARKASGNTSKEQMENVLPEGIRRKEYIAGDMPKCLRVNHFKTTVGRVLGELEAALGSESFQQGVVIDPDFQDLIVVSPDCFAEIKASKAVTEGRLIVEDKSSFWLPQHVRSILPDLNLEESQPIQVLDARAGCGIKALHLASLLSESGTVFACEARTGRLETLKLHKEIQGCQNLEIIESEFTTLDPLDPKFANVSVIIVEPLNSGTGILDKLGYLLQEEEYSSEQYSQKDLWALKSQQLATLRHAFSFPNIKAVTYVTRSINAEENEEVVRETLEALDDAWELGCVLPEVPVERNQEYEIEECLKITPSEATGNGIFIASFHPTPPSPPTPPEEVDPLTNPTDLDTPQKRRRKRKPHIRRKGELFEPRLTKAMAASVARLSLPRGLSTTRVVGPAGEQGAGSTQNLAGAAEGDHNPTLNPAVTDPADASDAKEKEKAPPRKAKQAAPSWQKQMGIYGLSLANFWGPRDAAYRTMNAGGGKWVSAPKLVSYPVPNPKPWK
ncbi:S-adenosyl-L-methionine-dependent methyltransferase [Fimicolochytrium jonesii]|uniref:S-adenosyl-L-methionine-dependent methyltransferase n=1 Tax=Fimicolochytrium jonesii TaxID=1396493 RepID=UPI0022FEA45C|nr:S-adenosyl-L-methionine-dependent methyltransferase [Fimicolochytrium jonesii]KAI8823776.1 S-adenosyl-L-methionine-dependent methyltransferase [Fimicolochytrium jonesii]